MKFALIAQIEKILRANNRFYLTSLNLWGVWYRVPAIVQMRLKKKEKKRKMRNAFFPVGFWTHETFIYKKWYTQWVFATKDILLFWQSFFNLWLSVTSVPREICYRPI